MILAIRVSNAFNPRCAERCGARCGTSVVCEQKYLLTNRGLCGIARADKRDYFTKSALVKKKSFRQIKFFA